MSGVLFFDLAGAAGHYVLVTLTAGLTIVGWTKTVGYRFHLLEQKAVFVERAKRHGVSRIQGLISGALFIVAVG